MKWKFNIWFLEHCVLLTEPAPIYLFISADKNLSFILAFCSEFFLFNSVSSLCMVLFRCCCVVWGDQSFYGSFQIVSNLKWYCDLFFNSVVHFKTVFTTKLFQTKLSFGWVTKNFLISAPWAYHSNDFTKLINVMTDAEEEYRRFCSLF